jgi:hypothetical protein
LEAVYDTNQTPSEEPEWIALFLARMAALEGVAQKPQEVRCVLLPARLESARDPPEVVLYEAGS